MAEGFFPNPYDIIDPDGIAHIGDEMSVEILRQAYAVGIFPWPHNQLPILWFCPQKRGVLDFCDFHIPRSLVKFLKKQNWVITTNQAFAEVIEACAHQPRPGQDGTWITPYMISKYIQFHQAGHAHSIECWEEKKLVGGLYGVFVNGNFGGESMFFRKQNASKACLVAIVKILQSLQIRWMDIQMVTDHMKRFGGKEIDKNDFLDRLQLGPPSLKNNGSRRGFVSPDRVHKPFPFLKQTIKSLLQDILRQQI